MKTTHVITITGILVEVEQGKKYARIVRKGVVGVSRSVHTFVNLENGDILKAASWKAPAPNGKRGNIFADDFGASCVTVYGAEYLK